MNEGSRKCTVSKFCDFGGVEPGAVRGGLGPLGGGDDIRLVHPMFETQTVEESFALFPWMQSEELSPGPGRNITEGERWKD